MPVSGPGDNLRGYHLVVVKRDDIAVSTKEAYAAITPQAPAKCCRDIVRQPIETWKEELVNDFEASIFKMHPELAEIKQKLYNLGAVYAAMSGSGSAIFGIFLPQFDGEVIVFTIFLSHLFQFIEWYAPIQFISQSLTSRCNA